MCVCVTALTQCVTLLALLYSDPTNTDINNKHGDCVFHMYVSWQSFQEGIIFSSHFKATARYEMF